MNMLPQANFASFGGGGCGGCGMAGSPQHVAMGAPMGGILGSGGSGNPGDWQCPNAACMNHSKMVFAKNASCPKCGAPKPTGLPNLAALAGLGGMGMNMMSMPGMGAVMGMGGGLPPKQRGGSNPGDWRCPNTDCKNHRNHVFAK